MSKFSPFGNKGIIIRFPCNFCDNPRIVSQELEIPLLSSHNQKVEQVQCDRCDHLYDVMIIVEGKEGFVRIEGIDENTIRVEEVVDPLVEEYYGRQEGAITNKNQLYTNYRSTIENLRKLNELQIESPELRSFLSAQIYIGVIATLETFLSDTFIYLTLTSEEYLKRFVKTAPELAKQKLELKDIFEAYQNIKETAQKAMLDIIYHNLPKVREMYQSTFDIDFRSIKPLMKFVMVRHDLVHRNGKTKDGDLIPLNVKSVNEVLDAVDFFVDDIAEKLDIKTYYHSKYNDDVADDLPF